MIALITLQRVQVIKKHQLRCDFKFGAMILIKSCYTDASYKKILCYCDHKILYYADHKTMFLKIDF